MIHYQLRCSGEHAFDGWFKDSATFEKQARLGLVSCPECGDTGVNRALMAPAIGRAPVTIDPAEAAETPKAQPPQPPPKMVLPDQVVAVLQRLRAEIERSSENVGTAFAEEARKIHRGETERRSIYGDATPGEAEALADEGISVMRVPWIKPADG